MSGNGEHIATGTYSNFFRVLKREEAWPAKSETLLEASRDPLRKRFQAPKARRSLLTQQHRPCPPMGARLLAFFCPRCQRFHADEPRGRASSDSSNISIPHEPCLPRHYPGVVR